MIVGFKMKLLPGCAAEYERRHSAIWPEMKAMIAGCGGSDYSIFLDERTNDLFACIRIVDREKWSDFAETEICRKWWDYMSDIMEVKSDKSPVSIPLRLMFHMD